MGLDVLNPKILNEIKSIKNSGLATAKAVCRTDVSTFQNFALNSSGEIVAQDLVRSTITHVEDLINTNTLNAYKKINIIKLPDNRLLRIYQNKDNDYALDIELVDLNTSTKTIDVVTSFEQDFTGETDADYKKPTYLGSCFDEAQNYIVVQHGYDEARIYLSAFKLDGDTITRIATTDTYDDFQYNNYGNAGMYCKEGFGVSVSYGTNDIVFKITDTTVEFTQLGARAGNNKGGVNGWFEYNNKVFYIANNNYDELIEVVFDATDYTQSTLTKHSVSIDGIYWVGSWLKDNKIIGVENRSGYFKFGIVNLDDFSVENVEYHGEEVENLYQHFEYNALQHTPSVGVIQVDTNTVIVPMLDNYARNQAYKMVQLTYNLDGSFNVNILENKIDSVPSYYPDRCTTPLLISKDNMTISYLCGYHYGSTDDPQKVDFIELDTSYIGVSVNGFVAQNYSAGDVATIYSLGKVFDVPTLTVGQVYGDKFIVTSEKQLIEKA